jgi:23S rRNA (guanosine2251-2'-O)-methyltransferase
VKRRGRRNGNERDAAVRQVYGVHAVAELLARRPDDVLRLSVAGDAPGASVATLLAQARHHGIAVDVTVERDRLFQLAGSRHHQGVVATARPYRYAALDDLFEAHPPGHRRVLVLDGIQDPRNLGALIRAAVAFDWSGVVVRMRRAVGVTAVVGAASAGAVEHCRVARVGNITAAVQRLQRAGFWVHAATPAGAGAQPPWACRFDGDVALVVGAEGSGVSRLVRASSDGLVHIPMAGPVASHSAPAAAVVIMYEIERQAACRPPVASPPGDHTRPSPTANGVGTRSAASPN